MFEIISFTDQQSIYSPFKNVVYQFDYRSFCDVSLFSRIVYTLFCRNSYISHKFYINFAAKKIPCIPRKSNLSRTQLYVYRLTVTVECEYYSPVIFSSVSNECLLCICYEFYPVVKSFHDKHIYSKMVYTIVNYYVLKL